MRAGTAKEIKFESIDSLFGIPDESKQHVTTMIPLESLYPYAQHPFRVLDDAKMDELVESPKWRRSDQFSPGGHKGSLFRNRCHPGTEEKEPVKKRGWKKCLLSSEN